MTTSYTRAPPPIHSPTHSPLRLPAHSEMGQWIDCNQGHTALQVSTCIGCYERRLALCNLRWLQQRLPVFPGPIPTCSMCGVGHICHSSSLLPVMIRTNAQWSPKHNRTTLTTTPYYHHHHLLYHHHHHHPYHHSYHHHHHHHRHRHHHTHHHHH